MYRRLRPNDYDGYQDHRPSLMLQQYMIQRGLLAGNHYIGWQRTGGSGNGCLVPTPGLYIYATHFYGASLVILEVVSGERTPLVGVYLPPSTLGHLPGLEEALTRFWDQEPVVLGDVNVDIQDKNLRSQQVSNHLI